MYSITTISFKKFVTWDERYWTGFPTSEEPTYMPLYWFQGGKFAFQSLKPVNNVSWPVDREGLAPFPFPARTFPERSRRGFSVIEAKGMLSLFKEYILPRMLQWLLVIIIGVTITFLIPRLSPSIRSIKRWAG